jgi:hypothetical protein
MYSTDLKINSFGSIMTTDLKKGVEVAPETPCISSNGECSA